MTGPAEAPLGPPATGAGDSTSVWVRSISSCFTLKRKLRISSAIFFIKGVSEGLPVGFMSGEAGEMP